MKRILFLVCLLGLLGCGEKYPHQFKSGDMVKMKLEQYGKCGMVIAVFSKTPTLQVRFSNTSGGYDAVTVSEFEVVAC